MPHFRRLTGLLPRGLLVDDVVSESDSVVIFGPKHRPFRAVCPSCGQLFRSPVGPTPAPFQLSLPTLLPMARSLLPTAQLLLRLVFDSIFAEGAPDSLLPPTGLPSPRCAK
jgi:hypothetical protein